jgi:hypothetical protein
MKKTTLIISGAAVLLSAGAYLFLKRPIAEIRYNAQTKSGTVHIAGKSGSFDASTGIKLGTWNGYSLSVSAGSDGSLTYRLMHFDAQEEMGVLTAYIGGSKNIQIIQTA